MSICLCCDTTLLRHIRRNSLTLYCPQCHQDMPSHSVTRSPNTEKEQFVPRPALA